MAFATFCCVALTAVLVIAVKLASATSAACLAALCTLSNALLAAATADFDPEVGF